MERNVWLEALLVGLIMVVLYKVASLLIRAPWLAVFSAGAVGHLLLEALGLNLAFCAAAYPSVAYV